LDDPQHQETELQLTIAYAPTSHRNTSILNKGTNVAKQISICEIQTQINEESCKQEWNSSL